MKSGHPRMVSANARLFLVFALIVSAIERVSAHALARLERDGNAGTCHE